MKHLSKEKRNQLILVIMATALVLSGLWFGLIAFQQQHLQNIARNREAAQKKLELMVKSIKNAAQIESDLADSSKTLSGLESGMAAGDLYSWAINAIRSFKQPYKIDIPQFSAIDGPKNCTLLPDFPFKQATMTVGGTAFYPDLGRFIADFENQFPYARVLNLNLEPYAGVLGAERDKLSFKLDIAFLVRPSAS